MPRPVKDDQGRSNWATSRSRWVFMARAFGPRTTRKRRSRRAVVRWAPSLINLINRVLQNELDILPERQPGQRLRILRDQIEVFARTKLDAHVFGIRMFLDLRVNPLIVVLEEILSGDELRLLRIQHQTFFPILGQWSRHIDRWRGRKSQRAP